MKITLPDKPKKTNFTFRLPLPDREFIDRVARDNRVRPADVLRSMIATARAKDRAA